MDAGTVTNLRRSDAWSPDVLGNLNASGQVDGSNHPFPGRTTTIVLDGSPGTKTILDLTDGQNRIDHRDTDTGSSSGADRVHYSYDAAGNLASDGVYFYQYDAWNRVVQVNRAVAVAVSPSVLASDGATLLDHVWAPDSTRLLKHYVYDGLGRLIRTQSPFPSADNNLGLRSEHFFYDGIRRVQEVMVDPIVALVDADSTGDAAVINAANQAQNGSPQPLDGEAAPLGVEGAQAIAVQPVTTKSAMQQASRSFATESRRGSMAACRVPSPKLVRFS